MKKCFKCMETKPLEYFYKHKMMADGHLNKCKDCAKKDVKKNRDDKIDYYREYDAWRFQNDPRVKERHIRYSKTKNGKASLSKSKIEYILNNPEKRLAHNIVKNAIRSGRLAKPDKCSMCCNTFKSRYIHGHHHDYDKPLDVIWLCAQCHVNEHKDGESNA